MNFLEKERHPDVNTILIFGRKRIENHIWCILFYLIVIFLIGRVE